MDGEGLYAYQFEAYNGHVDDTQGYRSRKDSVDVTVVAGSETAAQEKAKSVIERTDWMLENVYEVLADGESVAR